MSRFHVGDKVVFDINAYIADTGGKSMWASDVPTTPMTVAEIDGHTHKMEETMYSFHDRWLRPAKFEFREKGLGIERVLFNDPATIVFWTDGTKTVVKCRKGDKFDPEKGIAMACAKKLMGNEDGYYKTIEKYLTKSKATNGGIESMDTEEIRRAVREGCDLFDSDECHTKCPCHIDRICFTICVASRYQLIKMLKSFEKAGYFSYDDWRMHHA